jgi:hypothetical protein
MQRDRRRDLTTKADRDDLNDLRLDARKEAGKSKGIDRWMFENIEDMADVGRRPCQSVPSLTTRLWETKRRR